MGPLSDDPGAAHARAHRPSLGRLSDAAPAPPIHDRDRRAAARALYDRRLTVEVALAAGGNRAGLAVAAAPEDIGMSDAASGAGLPPFLLAELAQAMALLPPDLGAERAGLRLYGFGDILATGRLDPESQRHILVHAAAVAITALAAFERAAGRGGR